jgi:GNAT superfamily N-acetyltransferase
MTRPVEWLARAAGERWDEAAALVAASFPETALPEERMRALVVAGRYRVGLEVDAHGALAGVAVVALFAAEKFVHLDYLATAPAHRRTGVATRLVAAAAAAAPLPCDLLTLEVDETLVPFYRARGARLLAGVPYLFPATTPPMPMLLMAMPAGHAPATLGPTFPTARARDLVTALYRDLHGRDAAHDPLLASVLAGFPAEIVLH